MQSVEKYQKLVTALLAKTEAGDLQWQQMPRADVYMAPLKGNAVTIAEVMSRRDTDDQDYEISLLNADGNVVDRFRDIDLGAPVERFAAMRDLFVRARRQALGSDKVLNEILQELTAA
jgi:hypothetical protein